MARGERIEVVGEHAQPAVDEAFVAEALAMGVDPASLVSAPEADQADDAFCLFPENVESFDLFCGLATQWSWLSGGLGKPMRVGLNYPGVESAMRILGVRGERRRELFADIRLMERAALSVFEEAANRG